MSFEPLPHQAPRSIAVGRLVADQGFAMLGIAPAHASDHQAFFQNWLDEGKHGEMTYLAEHVQKRMDPAQLVPQAKAIICVADMYPSKPPEPQGSMDEMDEPQATEAVHGKIARYAWRRDYHRDMKKRLHLLTDAMRAMWPGHTFRATVDTAPVLEREHAQRAGIGWVGKHTLLIHPQKGSWFLLGEIITTLPLQSSVEAGAKIMTNHCGACTRCIDACPTQCITPYSLDAKRCISYLTLEHRTAIDPELHPAMGQWIAGCDVCQEVCPFNQPVSTQAAVTPMADTSEAVPVTHQTSLGLLEVMNWSPEARQEALIGSALKRIKLDQFKRNAIIAAGNVLREQADHPQANQLRQKIKQLACDPEAGELVQTTAKQVLAAAMGQSKSTK